MIDLHIKTSYSTGDVSVYRLFETIKDKSLEYFSIVDKNHCLAYNLIDKPYTNLITGVAINTIYNKVPIDLIGYDVDVDYINQWYSENYTSENIIKIEKDKAQRLKVILADHGYKVEIDDFDLNKLGNAYKQVFVQVVDNYDSFEYENERDFRLYGLNNPNSSYYLDQSKYFPSFEKTVSLLKKAKGKIFLAHPYEYRSDTNMLLNMVLEKQLDGVECFHSSSSLLNSLDLVDFCERHNLLASLGSGYVGEDEIIALGVDVDKRVLEKPCFSWIFNR